MPIQWNATRADRPLMTTTTLDTTVALQPNHDDIAVIAKLRTEQRIAQTLNASEPLATGMIT